MINILSLLLFVGLLSGGNLLFKKAALGVTGNSLPSVLLLTLQQPMFFAAIALYGATTFLWVWILSRVPLTAACPFQALPIIVVPLVAALMFGETQSTRYWIGAAMVALGIVLTQI